MIKIDTTKRALNWDVLTIKRRGVIGDVAYAKSEAMWVASSSTLLWGERDAILIDTFPSWEQSKLQVEWVAASGKNLTAVYMTRAHGDHFLGLAPLLECFPRARVVAIPQVVDAIFTRIAERLIVAEPLQEAQFELEGHTLVAVETGRTDTPCSTSLHVPHLGLLVAGGVVYNGVHPYLDETDTQSRREWIAALDKLEALRANVVVAGHKVPDNPDDPRDIARTRQYLRDFNLVEQATTTAQELYEAMLDLYPDRANPGSLWSAAKATKARRHGPIH